MALQELVMQNSVAGFSNILPEKLTSEIELLMVETQFLTYQCKAGVSFTSITKSSMKALLQKDIKYVVILLQNKIQTVLINIMLMSQYLIISAITI